MQIKKRKNGTQGKSKGERKPVGKKEDGSRLHRAGMGSKKSRDKGKSK